MTVEFDVATSTCPVCGIRLDQALSLETEMKPIEGDVTVCLYCASPLQFGAGLALERIDLSRLDPETIQNVNAGSCAHPPLEECASLFCVHCGVVKIDGQVLEVPATNDSRLSVLASLGVPIKGRKPE